MSKAPVEPSSVLDPESWRRGTNTALHGLPSRASVGRPGIAIAHPVNERDAATTSSCVYPPSRPMVKSSRHSRPKFSLRSVAVFVMPSRYTSIAGSLAIAFSRSAKLPVAWARRVRCCWYMRYGARTLATLVAKWSCQNHVIRSSIRRSALCMRSIHQVIGATISRTCFAAW